MFRRPSTEPVLVPVLVLIPVAVAVPVLLPVVGLVNKAAMRELDQHDSFLSGLNSQVLRGAFLDERPAR